MSVSRRVVPPVVAAAVLVFPVGVAAPASARPGHAGRPALAADPGSGGGRWSALGGELLPASGRQVGQLSLAAGRGGPLLSLSTVDATGVDDTTDVLRWTGSDWSRLGASLPDGGGSVTVDDHGQVWECTGSAGGEREGPLVRRWTGHEWSEVGGDVSTETGDARDRYAVRGCTGLLLDPSGAPVVTWIAHVGAKADFVYAARWDAALGHWVGLGGPHTGADRSPSAYADMDGAGNLYVAAHKPGGSYGGRPVSRVYRWDGGTWSMMGAGWEETDRPVVLAGEDEVYAGYADSTTGLIEVAQWVEADAAWQPLPSPGSGQTVALEMTRSGDLVAAVAPGPEQEAASIRVAVLDGDGWRPVGGPVGGPLTGDVYDLALAVNRADRPAVAWAEYAWMEQVGAPAYSVHAAGFDRPVRPWPAVRVDLVFETG